ncbi:MAG: DNA polymerase III subunit delta [Bacteroidota bacterium]
MTHQDIIKSLKAKQYKPVYFLYGNEAHYIDLISKYIEDHVLSEAERSFNQMVFYGKDTEAKTLIDTACRYPMMAPYQVVLLKEAQDMRSLADLLPYIEKPVPTTILVICYKYKRFDKRTKFAKVLKDKALMFESKKLYDNQVPDWIANYLRSKKLSIREDAGALVAEYLGTDLSKIANELDKLALNLSPGTIVSVKEVQDNIGISKEYNVFELQKALGLRDVLKANRIVNNFIANPKKHPLVMVVGALYNYFSKIYMLHYLRNSPDSEVVKALGLRSEYFLREYKAAQRHYNLPRVEKVIELLKTYDLRSKGVDNDSASGGELLREMVYRILHPSVEVNMR